MCNKSQRSTMQKRSFCMAIPIVLLCKGSRFAQQNDHFWRAKPIVLGRKRSDFATKERSACGRKP